MSVMYKSKEVSYGKSTSTLGSYIITSKPEISCDMRPLQNMQINTQMNYIHTWTVMLVQTVLLFNRGNYIDQTMYIFCVTIAMYICNLTSSLT